MIQDSEVILLKFMNGEIDLFGRYAQTSMYPTLKAGESNGKFKIWSTPNTIRPILGNFWTKPVTWIPTVTGRVN